MGECCATDLIEDLHALGGELEGICGLLHAESFIELQALREGERILTKSTFY
jgi:hypothetical protein